MPHLQNSFPTSPFRGVDDYTGAEANEAAGCGGANQYYTHEIAASPSIRKSLRNSFKRSSSKSSKGYSPPQIPYSNSMPDEHRHHDRPPIERTASGGLFLLNPNSPPKVKRSSSTGGMFARKPKKEDLVRARAEELGMRFERSTERALDGNGERDYLLNKAMVNVIPAKKSSKQLRKEALERYNAKKNNEKANIPNLTIGNTDPAEASKKSPQKKDKTVTAFAQPKRSPLSLGKKNGSPTSVIGRKKTDPLLASKPYQDPFFNLEETYEEEQKKSSRYILYETAEAMHNKIQIPTNGGEIAALGRHNVNGCVTTSCSPSSTAATSGAGCRDGATARNSERMQGLPALC